MKYNVLVYGSGGREHALAWKISQSPLLNKLFLALPNDGFKNLGEELIFSNFDDLAKKCVDNKIDLAVIGPEAPLAEGIVDVLTDAGIKCIGVNKKWAKLESSKKFAKEFMMRHDIPTAKHFVIANSKQQTENGRPGFCLTPAPLEGEGLGRGEFKVTNQQQIDEILAQFSTPPVLKADGLAAGKGVHLSSDFYDAKKTLKDFLEGKYGEASSSVVVEEKLEGEELSVIALFDGETLLPFVSARDYKRLYDGQIGPNTGGMGAYCPVKLTDEQQIDLNNYLKMLESALKDEKADFVGIIYSGLMLTNDGIKVLEYNMRFGDPETQPLMYHLESDLLELFILATEKKLSECILDWKSGTSIAVVVASDGYPENPKKGCEIMGLQEACENNDTQVFYAGVKKEGKKTGRQEGKQDEKPALVPSCSPTLSFISNGGRVLAICSNGDDIEKVRGKIYKTINEIEFEDKIYRNDIALIAQEIIR